VILAIAFGFGVALGLAYFAALRWNVTLYLSPGSTRKAIALHLARLAGIGVGLYLAARGGAGPLLAATLGVLVARVALTRPPREEPRP
jgi:F1F0 ATPase subunit 2